MSDPSQFLTVLAMMVGADKTMALWKRTDECLTGQLTGFEGSPWESVVNGLNYMAN